MAGKKKEQLPLPKRPYRADRDTRREDGVCNFETVRACCVEDATRARLMRGAVEQFPGLFDIEALALAANLDEGAETQAPYPTLASKLFFRDQRLRWTGAMWELAEDENLQPAMVATLRPNGMWVPHDELMNNSPRSLMRRLESDLFRAGITKLKGWLLAGLHAEFDVNRKGWDFHYHLAGGGEKGQHVDDLRDVRRFKLGRVQRHEIGLPESARIVCRREPLYNLPDPLTYVMQSHYPHRPTTAGEDDTLSRGEVRRRIPEPYHTMWLLWMNRWSLSDLIICVGMSQTNTGLVLPQQ